MADIEGVNIDGRPISSLRVIDLRKECEKRGLSKTGSKLQLSDRLKSHLLLQKLEHHSDSDYSSDAGTKVEDVEGIQNEFVKQYLERQKLLLESQTVESEQPGESFTDTSLSDSNIIKPDLCIQQNSENKSEKTVQNIELSFPVREQTAEKSIDKSIPETNQEIPEHTLGEEECNTESDMGRSKRKTTRVDENKGENKDKEPVRRGRRKIEEEDVEIDTGNVKKTETEEPLKSIANSGDNIFEKMDISVSKTEENLKSGSATKDSKDSDYKREDASNQGENTSNNADSSQRERKESSSNDAEPAERRKSNPKDDEFPERERRMSKLKDTESVGRMGSNPSDDSSVRERRGSNRRNSDPKVTELSRKNDDSPDEKTLERKGRGAERRGSNPTEKMECKVTSSQDNKTEKKQHALKRPGNEKHRRHSSSSSSRSRSRSQSPKQRTKAKKSRASSSDSSRSRSPARTGANRQFHRSRSRGSSSSRSRSRSPTPKHVRMKKRSESSSSRSRSSSRHSRPEVSEVIGQRSSSRSKSSSRSRSPDTEKMQAGDNTPSVHKEKSFYTEEEESPLPVKVKSRATIEIEKTEGEPVKANISEEKEDEGIPQESEKSIIPVKQIKKISLNRGKSNDLSKATEGEGEKMEEGEAKVANGEKPAKKRKWGSKSATSLQNKPKKASSLPISTDSLKGLIPDIKPSLKLAEPVTEEMDYEDDEEIPTAPTEPQEDTRDVKIQRTVVQEVKDNPDSPTSSDDETGEKDEKKYEESGEKQEVKKTDIEKTESDTETITKTITVTKKEKKDPKIVRQISNKSAVPLIKPDEPEAARRSPSPARNPTSKIVHVRNLVRPFTLGQLKELLRRTGPIVEEEFWIDKIKSHCFATGRLDENSTSLSSVQPLSIMHTLDAFIKHEDMQYESEEDAIKTRQSLHNTRWPHSNPKTLVVDYGTEEQVEFHKQKEMPVPVFPKKDKATLRKEREDKKEERLAREKEIEQRRKEREKRIKEREEREKRNKPKPVREWDREKLEKGDWDRTKVRSRSRSPHVRQRSGSGSPVRERRRSKERKEKKEKKEEEAPAKLLDDLFRKTKVTPCIYWLPLTEAQIEEKEKARQNRVEERLKRLAATELTTEGSPVKQKRRLSSPQAKEEKGRTRDKGSPARRQRSSDERPRRGVSDERGRQRADGKRDSRSRSGKRR